jgi:heterodisulfide reductase subunit C2
MATSSKGRLIDEMIMQCGQDPSECFQCAKCSAACPVTAAMDLLPHQIIRYLQLGFEEDLAKSKTPWICASCFTCAARCPRDLDLARMMEGIRLTLLRRREGNKFGPADLTPEQLSKLPQQALVSGFRKYNK